MAGITPKLAIEIDQHAAQTFRINHPESKVLQEDISTINPFEHINFQPFVLCGGPPCQGFSIANTRSRNLKNPNNWLFKEYLRFIKELQPRWFVFENVEGFKSFDNGDFALNVEKKLSLLGYETSSKVLNAADFGVPQNRNRYFIIGHLKKLGGLKFNFESLKKLPTITVGEALSNLPSLKNGGRENFLPYKRSSKKHSYLKLMTKNSRNSTQNFVTQNKDHIIERYKVIKQGENWKAAKNKGLLETYSSTKNTHSGIYRRLKLDEVAPTISNYRKSMMIHPLEHRGLSLREAARLQSFPDNFIFSGPLSYQQQQVGNAVPPLLAKIIFDQIIKLEETMISSTMNTNTISCFPQRTG